MIEAAGGSAAMDAGKGQVRGEYSTRRGAGRPAPYPSTGDGDLAAFGDRAA